MTIEELEVKLEVATKYRDAWRKMLDETNGHVRDLAALVEPGLNRHPITVIQAAQAFIRTLVEQRDDARAEVERLGRLLEIERMGERDYMAKRWKP